MKTIKELMTDMHFNLILYIVIAVSGFLTGVFGSDEAAKYISPVVLFSLKTITGALSAGALATKLFLSTSYSDWQAKRNGNGNSIGHTGDTTIINK